MRWISITDRLPENCQDIIILYPDDGYQAETYDTITYTDKYGFDEAEYPELITYWCAIPTLPGG